MYLKHNSYFLSTYDTILTHQNLSKTSKLRLLIIVNCIDYTGNNKSLNNNPVYVYYNIYILNRRNKQDDFHLILIEM